MHRPVPEDTAAGTTTASVFPTIHPVSVDAFFEQSRRRGLRMLCGKVLRDREPYAPPYLRDRGVAEAEQQTRELIGRWHGKDRLGYSVTPRFAPTSTERMLTMTGRLLEEDPSLWLQTHAAENKDARWWRSCSGAAPTSTSMSATGC